MSQDRPLLLFVEDDEPFRRIVARHLRARGYRVHEADSAEAATAVLTAGHRPALVILDVNLPGNTGWDLLRTRALADAGSPPVVVASAVQVNPKRLAEFGCVGYLPKPFPLDTLEDTVARLLREKEPTEDHD